MSEDFERKKHIFKDLYAFREEYISDSEYRKLSEEEKGQYLYDSSKTQYYIKRHLELSDEELNAYINMKIIDYLSILNSKINTIKNILIFWFILMVFGIIITISAIATAR